MTTIGSNVRIRYESRHKHPELGHIPALRLIPIPPLPSSPQSPHSGPANPPLPTRLFSERAPSPPRHLPPTSQSAFLDPGPTLQNSTHTHHRSATLHRFPLHRTRSISERAPYPIRRAQLEHTLKRFPDPRPERIPAAPSAKLDPRHAQPVASSSGRLRIDPSDTPKTRSFADLAQAGSPCRLRAGPHAVPVLRHDDPDVHGARRAPPRPPDDAGAPGPDPPRPGHHEGHHVHIAPMYGSFGEYCVTSAYSVHVHDPPCPAPCSLHSNCEGSSTEIAVQP